MLATLFDYPFQDRRLLTYWSDVAALSPQMGHQIDSWEKRKRGAVRVLGLFHTALERTGKIRAAR
ncbi:hypothetical protein ACVWZL_000725 [Bradyrhizobium sp. GM2.4]